MADGSGPAPHTPGPGAPYPATVPVSGLAGPVTDVNVTIKHVGHNNPDDFDVMLVGPQGQRVVILSDAGESFPLTGADLTFDDQAAGPAPDMAGISSGSYKPTNHFGGLGEPPDGNDPFVAPAPGPPRAATLAAAFNGTDANGNWSLFVVDDRPGDTGAIAEGFSVQITTGITPPPPPPPAATNAEFQPEPQSADDRLHRLVTLDGSRSVIGDPRNARMSWDVNSDGRAEAVCSGLQSEVTTHVATTAQSLPVTLTVREPSGISSVAKQTVSVPLRSAGPGSRRAGAAQSRGLVRQLNSLDKKLKAQGNSYGLVCEPPPNTNVGDLTDNGGPGIGCATSVQTVIIDAIGCFERVNGPRAIPIAERRLVTTVVETVFQPPTGRRSAAGRLSAAGARARAAAIAIPKAFGSNAYGRVDPPLPEVASKTADIVAELDPHVAKRGVRINGIDLTPKPGASIVIWGMEKLVASSNAVVKVGPATIHSGSLVWRMPDAKRNHLGDFNLSGSLGSALGGLDADGRVGLDFGRFSSELTVNARLPRPITDDNNDAVTGATTLRLDNAHGLDASGSTLDLKTGRVGGVEVIGSRLRFDAAAGSWQGDVKVYVPPNGFPTGQLSIRNNALEYLRLRSGPFDAGAGTLIDGLDLSDRRDGGFKLAGPAAGRSPLSLPFLGNTCPVVQAAGEGSLTGAKNSGRLDITGGGTRILCIGVPDGRFTTTEGRLTEATGTWRADLVKGRIFIEMPLQGRVSDGRFQANGGARACINILIDICKGADAVFSDTGIGVCTDVGLSGPFNVISVRVGGGVRFKPPIGQKVFAASCDLKPFSSFASARSAAGERRLRFPAGLEAAYIEFEGRDGAPSITMTGPGGRRVVTPPSGKADGKQGYVLDRDADTGITYVLLGKPAGTWTISEDAGSPAIAAVRSASSLPSPSVKASVRGRGTRHRLFYRVKAIRGQRVRFAEVGKGAFRELGSARGSRGSLRFSPAPGPRGKRKIVATIEQNGLPREAVTVATYKAVPGAPARPRRVRLRRKGARVLVAWDRVRGAARYRVTARLSDGRRDVLVVRGTKATLGHVPPSGRGLVTVRAVDARQKAGSGRSAKLKAKARPRPKPKRRAKRR